MDSTLPVRLRDLWHSGPVIVRRFVISVSAVFVSLGLAACMATNTPAPAKPATQAVRATAATGASTQAASVPAAPAGFKNCTYAVTGQPAKPVDPPNGKDVPATGTVVATVTMTEGKVQITMDRAKTPCTVASFLSLAQQKFYDGTKCHRLADKGLFMLQCGDPTGTGRGGPGYQYADETYPTDTYAAGTVAMANAGKNTNGSQFFFVYQNSQLPPNYTVFGKLDQASLGVIARMAAEGQDGTNPDGTGRPNNPSQIISISVG
jgi:peptidyl-prolyl cis-trans isomerase B (cyclophilin B)